MSSRNFPDGSVSPSLRDYLEQRLDYERTASVTRYERMGEAATHLREILEQKIALLEDARRLQAVEYERRLTMLNHSHDRAIDAQARTVSREIWEAYLKEDVIFKQQTAKQFASITTQFSVIATRSQTWTLVIGIVFAVLNVLIRFWPSSFVVR